jgi:hypothetical protein
MDSPKDYHTTSPETRREMKRNIWVTGVALLLTACLLSSCTHTVTWRDIKKDPVRYMNEEKVTIKGQVDAVSLDTKGERGELIVRTGDGETGRVEFPGRNGVRSRGDKVIVTGKIQQAQRGSETEYYLFLEELKDPGRWWVAPANIIGTPIAVAYVAYPGPFVLGALVADTVICAVPGQHAVFLPNLPALPVDED